MRVWQRNVNVREFPPLLHLLSWRGENQRPAQSTDSLWARAQAEQAEASASAETVWRSEAENPPMVLRKTPHHHHMPSRL